MTLNIRLGQAGEGGGGSAHPTAGKFRHRSSAGEKVDAGYPHPSWSR